MSIWDVDGIERDDGQAVAEAAGLHYVLDDAPGYARRRRGAGFSYHSPTGTVLDGAARERIEGLVIPPAWTDVWINPDPDGHLQATGRDDRGRKQYLYHARWREIRDDLKFADLGGFARSLPSIRRHVEADLAGAGLSRRRVVAAVVRLLDTTLIRIGNDAYAADNETFGASTLEPRHVARRGDGYELCFTGKSNVERTVTVVDPPLVDVIRESLRRRQDQLFCFDDGPGAVTDLTSEHVNDYLAELGAPTAKTFRTWGATAIFVDRLGRPDPELAALPDEKRRLDAIDTAAEALGNTRAVCRSCYVAPAVVSAAETGALDREWAASRSSRWRTRAESTATKLLT